jgi:hypothetical protein
MDIEQIHRSSPGACAVIVYFLAFQYDQVIATTSLAGIQPLRFNVLCGNLAFERLFNACGHQVAFGDREGTIRMLPVDYNQHGNFDALGLSVYSEWLTGEQVRMMTFAVRIAGAAETSRWTAFRMRMKTLSGGVCNKQPSPKSSNLKVCISAKNNPCGLRLMPFHCCSAVLG